MVPFKAFSRLYSLFQATEGEFTIHEVGFPAQLLGRMGVGVGNEGIGIQRRKPPVHGRIGGKACFQGVNIGGHILIAFLYGVKAGKSPEKGKVRRPYMRWNQNSGGAAGKDDFKKIPAVQPQNGPAVGMDVPDGFQLFGYGFCFFHSRQENHIMYFPNLPVLFVNGADFSRNHKAGHRYVFPGGNSCIRKSCLMVYRPSSAGSRRSRSISRHPGCVKSPVPKRPMPFLRAQRSRYSGMPSLLVARENLEWICRSAIYMIVLRLDVFRKMVSAWAYGP